MKSAPKPRDEAQRLADLEEYGVLDTLPERDFDDLTRIAAEICGTPISLVSLVDDHRQWFKSRHGLDATETPREVAFCAHAILGDDLFVVEDAFEDDRFHDNPLVVDDPNVRFYAGAPLKTPQGHNLGTLCVIDHEPRRLSESQKEALTALARQVVSRLELGKQIAELEQVERERDEAEEGLRAATGPLRPLTSGPLPSLTPHRRIIELIAPLVVLLVLSATTFWIARLAESRDRDATQTRFDTDVEWVHRGIQARMQDYEELLKGCAALFAASEAVTKDEWRRFVDAIAVERRYPGVLGTGYTVRITPDELPGFVSWARSNAHPDYTVRPEGPRPDYFPILYLEPIERNRAAVGFDIGSEEHRRRAAERARDTGETSVSGRIILVQDNERLPGFLLLVPVYRRGLPLETVLERREAFVGWVYIASRAKDLLSQLPNVRADEVGFSVWDGAAAPENLLFEGGSTDDELSRRSGLSSQDTLSLFGRDWTVQVEPSPAFAKRAAVSTHATVLSSGLIISVLFSAFLWSVLATRRRALLLADEMTQTITRNQRHIRTLVDSLGEAVITIDDDGKILSANRAAETLFDRRQANLLRQPITSLVPDAGSRSLHGLHVVPHQDGERILEVSSSEMGSASDRSTILILRDVTARERMQREKEVVQMASVAVAEASSFDSALQALLEKLRRVGDWQFAESWLPNRERNRLIRGPVWCADDASDAIARFDEQSRGHSFALGKGLPGICFLRGEVVTMEQLAENPEFVRNEEAGAAGLHAAAAIPVSDERDEIVAVLVFFAPAFDDSLQRNLTILSAAALQLGSLLQHKRYEDELSASEERYRDLFDGANDLIQSVSPEGQILYANRAWLETLGYEPRDLGKMSLWDIIAPESQEHCVRIFGDVKPGEDIGKVDAVFLTRDGERRMMEGNVSCSFDGNRLVSTRGIFRDITERFAVEKMKKEFVSTVSHELRTPLTSIRGSLDLLGGQVFGSLTEGALEVVNIAHRNCTRLIDLINDILDLEKLDSGRMELYPEPVALADLFREAQEAVGSFARQHGIRMVASATDCWIEADRNRMIQVLVNLLSNAIKFSEPDSEVRILARETEGDVIFAVEDDGKGIPPEFISRIFDRFQQVESSDARPKGGSGLGLAICRAIVEQHGGTIGVESEVGEGSRFWIRLRATCKPDDTTV